MIGQLRVRTVAFTAAVLLLSGGVLAGCSRPEEEPGSAPQSGSTAPGHEGSAAETAAGSDNPLAGTNWRLVEFQSMDDATGKIRPDDPSLYTMRLNADGTVNMRLNCNR